MPKFLIERALPGAGALTPQQLQQIARKSVEVLTAMGPSIQWVQSYIADEALYCVYIAPDEKVVRDHACRGGFPITRVTRIGGVFDPTTAETA
jgi:uncharacterized protein DUF4242